MPFSASDTSLGSRYSPPQPSGSGRFCDFVWPDAGSLNSNGAASTRLRTRGNSVQQAAQDGVSTASAGTNTGTATIGVNGCVLATPASGNSIELSFENSLMLHHRTTKGAVPIAPQCDVEGVYRLIAILKGDGGNRGMVNDFGFQCVVMSGLAPQIILGAQLGFGFQIADTNTVRFIARGPNGLQSVALTAAPFDINAVFHALEMRIISASKTDALMKVFIDGVPITLPAAFATWGPGTNLPPNGVLTGGRMGFRPTLINGGGAAAGNMVVQKLMLQSAPTEADVL